MSIIGIVNLLRILFFLLGRTGTFGELDENFHIDDSRFGPLESPDFLRNFATIPPQDTNFTDILAVSNAIKSVQKTWKNKKKYLSGMQAYLTTSTGSSSGNYFESGNRFNLVTFNPSLFYSFITDHTKIRKPFAKVTASNYSRTVKCTNFVLLNQTDISVEIVNSTRLDYILKSNPEINNPHIAGLCSLVLFYVGSCQFCMLAAPHFNVLPRIFPQVKMVAFNALSVQRYFFGITGVPSLFLFHKGKLIAKYNGSDYSLNEFTKFVVQHTDLTPNEKVVISVADIVKPVPWYVTHDYSLFYDCHLWLAWLIIIFWTVAYVCKLNF